MLLTRVSFTRPVCRAGLQTSSEGSGLNCDLYSGTGAVRDPCCRGLKDLYAFGPSKGDTTGSPRTDDTFYSPMVFSGTQFVFFGTPYNQVGSGGCVRSTCTSTAHSAPRASPLFRHL
jgi:hypothetical protein